MWEQGQQHLAASLGSEPTAEVDGGGAGCGVTFSSRRERLSVKGCSPAIPASGLAGCDVEGRRLCGEL